MHPETDIVKRIVVVISTWICGCTDNSFQEQLLAPGTQYFTADTSGFFLVILSSSLDSVIDASHLRREFRGYRRANREWSQTLIWREEPILEG